MSCSSLLIFQVKAERFCLHVIAQNPASHAGKENIFLGYKLDFCLSMRLTAGSYNPIKFEYCAACKISEAYSYCKIYFTAKTCERTGAFVSAIHKTLLLARVFSPSRLFILPLSDKKIQQQQERNLVKLDANIFFSSPFAFSVRIKGHAKADKKGQTFRRHYTREGRTFRSFSL